MGYIYTAATFPFMGKVLTMARHLQLCVIREHAFSEAVLPDRGRTGDYAKFSACHGLRAVLKPVHLGTWKEHVLTPHENSAIKGDRGPDLHLGVGLRRSDNALNVLPWLCRLEVHGTCCIGCPHPIVYIKDNCLH